MVHDINSIKKSVFYSLMLKIGCETQVQKSSSVPFYERGNTPCMPQMPTVYYYKMPPGI